MDIKTEKKLTALSLSIPKSLHVKFFETGKFVRSSHGNFLCWATMASAAGSPMVGYKPDVTKIKLHFVECTVHADKEIALHEDTLSTCVSKDYNLISTEKIYDFIVVPSGSASCKGRKNQYYVTVLLNNFAHVRFLRSLSTK
jgi:hypothetical protein